MGFGGINRDCAVFGRHRIATACRGRDVTPDVLWPPYDLLFCPPVTTASLQGTAVFSACGLYRYRLDRYISEAGPRIVFLLHNPSTASGSVDDPTSRRGIDFARRWGGSSLIFVNLWAGIATRPRDLWKMQDAVGPDNDIHIKEAADEARQSAGFVVLAWGATAAPSAFRGTQRQRRVVVEETLQKSGCEIRCLGRNSDGSPKHPLYIHRETMPQPWMGGHKVDESGV